MHKLYYMKFEKLKKLRCENVKIDRMIVIFYLFCCIDIVSSTNYCFNLFYRWPEERDFHMLFMLESGDGLTYTRMN